MTNDRSTETDAELKPILRISSASYNPSTKELFVRGWRLLKGKRARIKLYTTPDKLLGEATQGKSRSDVFKQYPGYNDREAGWVYSVKLQETDLMPVINAALSDAADDRTLVSTSHKVSVVQTPTASAESGRFVLTLCNYDTESKHLEIAGEAYPEQPPRRLFIQLGNGQTAPMDEFFLPSGNSKFQTGGVVNGFGGFRSLTRFVGQGALASIAVAADLIDGGQVVWAISRDQISYDQPKAQITRVRMDKLRDRLRCEGWFRSYEPVTTISLRIGNQVCHGIPTITEDPELTRKLGFRGPLVHRFVYDLVMSEAISQPGRLFSGDLSANLTLLNRDTKLGQFSADASAIETITAKATMIVFDRRNSMLLVWGECAPGYPPESIDFCVSGRQIGSPLIPVLPDLEPTAEVTSWFVAGEVNFELLPNHAIELLATSDKTHGTEKLAELPKPIIVSADNRILGLDEAEVTQQIYNHNFAGRRLPEPTICFVLQGSILQKGGGTTRVRNMMQGFKAAGYSVALIDRMEPWDYLEELQEYKALRRYCDAHLMIPQPYKPGLLDLALKDLKQTNNPDADTRSLTTNMERARKIGRLMKREGQPFYDRVDSQFNYTVAAILHSLLPDVVISQFAWSCEVHTALPKGTYGMIDTHDIQSARYEAFSKALDTYGPEAIPNLEKFRVDREAEQTMLGMAPACIAISPDEKAELDEMIGSRNTVLAMPTSESTEFFGSAPHSLSLLFVGNDYEANNFGIDLFLRKTWPLIRNAVGAAHLNIVGGCGKKVRQYASDDVTVHGVVGDITPLYRDAAVIINPALFGTGIAVKMIEALSNGKAIVSTTVGARGLEQAMQAGAIRVADSPEDFAARVVELLTSYTERAALEKSAHAFAETYLQPEVIYSNLFNFLESKLFY
jgi:hypothetical protein